MPQNAAGLRSDPPVSEPEQIGTMPVASATADPPDEPAAERRRIERIAGRTIDGVARVRAGAEFRRVGLADDDRTGLAHRRHDAFVGSGDVVAEDRAAEGGAQTSGFLQVLDADRQAVQRRQIVAARNGCIGRFRCDAGSVEVARDHGVHRMVHRLDAVDAACRAVP